MSARLEYLSLNHQCTIYVCIEHMVFAENRIILVDNDGRKSFMVSTLLGSAVNDSPTTNKFIISLASFDDKNSWSFHCVDLDIRTTRFDTCGPSTSRVFNTSERNIM